LGQVWDIIISINTSLLLFPPTPLSLPFPFGFSLGVNLILSGLPVCPPFRADRVTALDFKPKIAPQQRGYCLIQVGYPERDQWNAASRNKAVGQVLFGIKQSFNPQPASHWPGTN
jgi:hypothetical protein